MKCIRCDRKKFFETTVRLFGGISAKAWECKNCGEAVLDPEATEKALLLNRLSKGINVKVGSLGNSLVMRFPAELVELIGLKKGSKVTVKPDGFNKVIVTTA